LRAEFETSESVKLIEVNRASKWIPRAEQEPPFPATHADIFQIYYELHAARSNNGFGANPISYSELEAYSRLTRRALGPWEVKMLRRIDSIFLLASSKAQKIESGKLASRR